LPTSISGEDMQKQRIKGFLKLIDALGPLYERLKDPGPYDWLSTHHEPGQTFLEYIKSNPVLPTAKRNIIYIQPIGEFKVKQREIIKLTAEFLGIFFNLPVQIKAETPLSVIPSSARRKHPSLGMEQILTTYVLEDILMPKLPKNAAILLAFTTLDLWPQEGWNFVFGQASIEDRVGVWSIYRNGNPDKSESDFYLCLLRTLKTAVHESGHMFSIMHCIKYECLMRGSNYRAESDRRPLAFCPEDAAKIGWACSINMIERYENLVHFCRRNGLLSEAEFYEKSIKVLKAMGVRRDVSPKLSDTSLKSSMEFH